MRAVTLRSYSSCVAHFALAIFIAGATSCRHSFQDNTMTSNETSWIIIDRAQRELYMTTPYNPPTCEKAMFRQEWYRVYTKIKRALEKYWKYGVGDGDFFISSDPAPDRSIGVAISDEGVIGRQAIAAVQKVLAQLDVGYSVEFCNGSVFLRTPEDEPYPDFNIIIERERVSVFSESDRVLELLELKRPATGDEELRSDKP